MKLTWNVVFAKRVNLFLIEYRCEKWSSSLSYRTKDNIRSFFFKCFFIFYNLFYKIYVLFRLIITLLPLICNKLMNLLGLDHKYNECLVQFVNLQPQECPSFFKSMIIVRMYSILNSWITFLKIEYNVYSNSYTWFAISLSCKIMIQYSQKYIRFIAKLPTSTNSKKSINHKQNTKI